MAKPPTKGPTKADLLQTRMTPGEKELAKGVKTIGTKLTSRQPTRRTDPGAVVRFTYKHHTGLKPGEPVDDHKEVLVLHPNWAGKMHGIDLKRLTAAEREVLSAIFDRDVAEAKRAGRPHRLPLVNDILNRMDPVEDVKNPVSFYSKFVKVFIRNADAYRTYYPRLMWAVTVVQKSDVSGNVMNPKPLFKRMASKPAMPQHAEPTPPGALAKGRRTKGQLAGRTKPQPKALDRQNRIELIKARQAALKKPPRPR